jgi:hypothetical protein
MRYVIKSHPVSIAMADRPDGSQISLGRHRCSSPDQVLTSPQTGLRSACVSLHWSKARDQGAPKTSLHGYMRGSWGQSFHDDVCAAA